MSISGDTPRENLTLTEADLATCRPIVGECGHVLRALCPFHGSDRQRSLRVQVHSGRFVCFACGAWGYMETAREQWREEQQRQAAFGRPPARRQRVFHRRQSPPRLPRPAAAAARTHSTDPPAPREPAPARPDLAQSLAVFQAALPGSRGETYLQQRWEKRPSRCLSTNESPGRSASRSWSSMAASRTRKPRPNDFRVSTLTSGGTRGCAYHKPEPPPVATGSHRGGPPCSRLAHAPSVWRAPKTPWPLPRAPQPTTPRASPVATSRRARALARPASVGCSPPARPASWSRQRGRVARGSPALGPPQARAAGASRPPCSPHSLGSGANPTGGTPSNWLAGGTRGPSLRSMAQRWRRPRGGTGAGRGQRPAALSRPRSGGGPPGACGPPAGLPGGPPGARPPSARSRTTPHGGCVWHQHARPRGRPRRPPPSRPPRPRRPTRGCTPSADAPGARRRPGGLTKPGPTQARRPARTCVGRPRGAWANARGRGAPAGTTLPPWAWPSHEHAARLCGRVPRQGRCPPRERPGAGLPQGFEGGRWLSDETQPRCGVALDDVQRRPHTLVPSVRPAPDGHPADGRQPTASRRRTRRVFLAPALPMTAVDGIQKMDHSGGPRWTSEVISAPSVGVALDPRRSAVRGESPRWYTRSGSRPGGSGVDGQCSWWRGCVHPARQSRMPGRPPDGRAGAQRARECPVRGDGAARRSQARPVADGCHLRHT